MSQNMQELGKMSMNFRLYGKLERLGMLISVGKWKTKVRYNMMDKTKKEKAKAPLDIISCGEDLDEKNKNKDENQDEPKAFDTSRKFMNLENLKATDLKVNQSINWPLPAPTKIESKINCVEELVMEAFEQSKDELQSINKNKANSNLSNKQQKAVKELTKMENREVLGTDKSKKP